MSISSPRPLCKPCAHGLDQPKEKHTGDSFSCVFGFADRIREFPAKDQMKEILIHERLDKIMADHIMKLSKLRKKNPLDIMVEEGFYSAP